MKEKRATLRFRPIKAITVAVESDDGLPAGFGIVADISEGGACLVSDVSLPVGANVTLLMAFPDNRIPFSTPGKLCWVRKDLGSQWMLVRYGIQFELEPWRDSDRLKSLIAEVAEETATVAPQPGPPP